METNELALRPLTYEDYESWLQGFVNNYSEMIVVPTID